MSFYSRIRYTDINTLRLQNTKRKKPLQLQGLPYLGGGLATRGHPRVPEDPFIAEDGLARVLVGVQEVLAGWGTVVHAV